MRLILPFFILLFAATSCKKQQSTKPEPPKDYTRLIEWTHASWGHVTKYYFEYNAEGKISKYTKGLPSLDTSSGPRNIVTTYQYGENGKISSETTISPDGSKYLYTYQYYADGRLRAVEHKNDAGLVTLVLTYEYSGSVMHLQMIHGSNGGVSNYKINFDSSQTLLKCIINTALIPIIIKPCQGLSMMINPVY